MKEKSDLKFRKTLEDIRLHFDFLFKRGFRIASVLFADKDNEKWQVTLMGKNCLVNIYGEPGIIDLALGTMSQPDELQLFDLQELAQTVEGGYEFSQYARNFSFDETQQFIKIANFLEKNFAVILQQVERKNLPALKHPLNKSNIQPKRTIT
jgi:hypothetical protein